MPFKIAGRGGALVPLVLLLFPPAAAGQARCPPEAGRLVEAGWQAYRSDSIAVARERFTRARTLCAGNLDATLGLGFTALREGAPGRAAALFRAVIDADSGYADAWTGLALASSRRGDTAGAIRYARRALALNPGDRTSRDLLDRIAPDWERPPLAARPRPESLRVAARVNGERFEVPARSGWAPFYIKGMNLGVALPGRFPAEFPQDSARYAGWLDTLAAMNANVVRLYTILPPAFYRALRGWNLRNPDRPLWLVHGVWTELPPGDDFEQEAWKREFRAEMQRVVDLVHGAVELPPRPGHASGRYDADVSAWTLAYIIGREWEPYSVIAFDRRHADTRRYAGRFLAVDEAPATEVWMAEQCDYMLAYEVDRFNAIRPIAFTNWPTLDPLRHPTETTIAEEVVLRRRLGRAAELLREYDNDAIAVDANLVRATAANPAGWFASYHAYPYYPDFMLYDPGYNQARSSEGRSNYFGYLRDLRRHHAGMPLVIAEYGVPSSRGVAHLQPQGWHHGGHDEQAMAAIDARLTREIHESGAAGGILFAWIDEWFKKNWIVIDFQVPAENTRQWHNVMDAEQHYGVLGMVSSGTRVLGGDPADWTGREPPATNGEAARRVVAAADESYLYLAVPFPELAGRAFPWDTAGIMIAVDTWLPATGQHVLPGGLLESEMGFEFLLDFRSPADAEIRILPEYNPHGPPPDSAGDDHGRFYHRPVTVVNRRDGRFDSLYVTTNRARFGRDGSFFPAAGVNRGRLRHGTGAQSTLSDWYYDQAAGLLEVRVPWGLLNVSDPSSRTILYERRRQERHGTVTADGFHFGLVVYRKGPVPGIVTADPAPTAGGWRLADFTPWRWDTWQEPRWRQRLKPAYEAMREVWGGM